MCKGYYSKCTLKGEKEGERERMCMSTNKCTMANSCNKICYNLTLYRPSPFMNE